MLLTLEGKIIEMQQARDPAWTAAHSSWLVAAGCLRYKHLSLSSPVKISRSSMATATRGSRPTTGRDSTGVHQPVSPTDGTWLTRLPGAGAGDKCGICFHPVSGPSLAHSGGAEGDSAPLLWRGGAPRAAHELFLEVVAADSRFIDPS